MNLLSKYELFVFKHQSAAPPSSHKQLSSLPLIRLRKVASSLCPGFLFGHLRPQCGQQPQDQQYLRQGCPVLGLMRSDEDFFVVDFDLEPLILVTCDCRSAI